MSSYEKFAKSILNLFSKVELSENEKELQNAIPTFPRFSKKFAVVKSELGIKTDKKDKYFKYTDVMIIRRDHTGIIIETKYDNNKKTS